MEVDATNLRQSSRIYILKRIQKKKGVQDILARKLVGRRLCHVWCEDNSYSILVNDSPLNLLSSEGQVIFIVTCVDAELVVVHF